MRALVFAGGEVRDYGFIKSLIKNDDLLIAADSGAEHLYKIGLEPDILIGDMDSISVKPYGKEIIKLNVMKDETDTEAAVRVAAENGADEIVIVGATGTRLDHSLANLLMLKSLSEDNIKAQILDEKNSVRYVDGSFEIDGAEGDTVSIIPLTRLHIESTKGLLYEVMDGFLEVGSSRGVSNVMTSNTAKVTLKSGTALVIKSKD